MIKFKLGIETSFFVKNKTKGLPLVLVSVSSLKYRSSALLINEL